MHDEVLSLHFPQDAHRFFLPMRIGSTPEHADEGAALILAGRKTATSSALWHYPDGRLPFVGALSVLVDGSNSPRGIVETRRVEHRAFGGVDEAFARDYGEGTGTLQWWRTAIGGWYRGEAVRHNQVFEDSTPLVCEWFEVVVRL